MQQFLGPTAARQREDRVVVCAPMKSKRGESLLSPGSPDRRGQKSSADWVTSRSAFQRLRTDLFGVGVEGGNMERRIRERRRKGRERGEESGVSWGKEQSGEQRRRVGCALYHSAEEKDRTRGSGEREREVVERKRGREGEGGLERGRERREQRHRGQKSGAAAGRRSRGAQHRGAQQQQQQQP
eukprot:3495179-Rhodomonas_salina.1